MRPSARLAGPIVSAVLVASSALAQTEVRDIDLEPLVPGIGSVPRDVVPSGALTFFQGRLPSVGTELFVSDGTPGGTGLLKDVEPGSPGSSPRELTVVGGTLFFGAETDEHGIELWKSDGTAAGTELVVDLNGTIGVDTLVRQMVAFDGKLVFTDFVSLFESDGTAAGTKVLSRAPVAPKQLTVIGSELYFVASEPGFGIELWKSDGTAGGTARIADIDRGMLSSFPDSPTGFQGEVFFGAQTLAGGGGRGLWKTDGTAAGTEEVYFVPGDPFNPDDFVVFGSHLYFVGQTNAEGRELWRTDGTTAGTELVVDVEPGPSSSDIEELTVVGGTLYFVADAGGLGTELWMTDGTAGGTAIVADLSPGPGSSTPAELTPLGSSLVFVAFSETVGVEPWVTDGSSVTLLRDIDPAGSSSPSDLARVGGEVWFAADDGVSGRELWRTDGSPAGTAMVADAGSSIASAGSTPREAFEWFGRLLFLADDGISGIEPWTSDGTPGGTAMLVDAFPGPESASSFLDVVEFEDRLLFTTTRATAPLPGGGITFEFGLWSTDGTPGGTHAVTDGTPLTSVGFGIVVDGRYFFTGETAAGGRELWALDAPGATPQLVVDLDPAGSSDPRYLAEFDGDVLFVADGGSGDGIWRSDGTPGNATLVADAGNVGILTPRFLTNAGGTVWFSANAAGLGFEVWATDGTTAGTHVVTEIAPGTGVTNVRDFDVFGDRVIFTAQTSHLSPVGVYSLDDPLSQPELLVTDFTFTDEWLVVDDRLFLTSANRTRLWASDGTVAGTANLVAGGSAVRVESLTRAGSTGTDVWFTHRKQVSNGPDTKTTLWRTDGTPAGTGFVADVDPAGNLSAAEVGILELRAVGAGPELLVSGNDHTHGPEVWLADGTPGGVTRLTDVAAGPLGSFPAGFVRVGGRILFTADDGAKGAELWSLPFAATGGSALDPFGAGCPGSNGLAPRFRPNGPAHIGGTLDFSCVDAPPFTAALLFVSPKRAALPVDGCTSYLGTPLFYQTAKPTGVNGVASFSPNIQADPDLVAVPLHYQWVVLDPGGPFAGTATLSDGLEVLIGP